VWASENWNDGAELKRISDISDQISGGGEETDNAEERGEEGDDSIDGGGAEWLPRSLPYASPRDKLRRGRKGGAASVGMTNFRRQKPRAKRGRVVALERKSPLFIPKRHRDGAEIAKSAKDGAASSSIVR